MNETGKKQDFDPDPAHQSFSDIQIGGGSYVDVPISSDSEDEGKQQDAPILIQEPVQEKQTINENENREFEEEDLPESDEEVSPQTKESKEIVSKFQKYLNQAKKTSTINIDVSRVELAPPNIRKGLYQIIKNVERLSKRNPTNASLSALQVLVERLDEFLEMQTRREDPNYDQMCIYLLNVIYRNTVEAQRLSRSLRDAAKPRPLDEYKSV